MGDDQKNGSSRHPTDMSGVRDKDLAVAVASLAFGFLVLAVLIPQSIGPIGSNTTILALIGAVGLVVFGAVLGLAAYRVRPAGGGSPKTDASGDAVRKSGKVQAVGLVIGAVIYAWALEWIGFLPASYLTLAGLLLLMGVRSVLIVLALPVVVIFAIYLGIDVGLGASLPEGRLEWPFLTQSGAIGTEYFHV